MRSSRKGAPFRIVCGLSIPPCRQRHDNFSIKMEKIRRTPCTPLAAAVSGDRSKPTGTTEIAHQGIGTMAYCGTSVFGPASGDSGRLSRSSFSTPPWQPTSTNASSGYRARWNWSIQQRHPDGSDRLALHSPAFDIRHHHFPVEPPNTRLIRAPGSASPMCNLPL